jgi:uroporphyrinogen decarboxylase
MDSRELVKRAVRFERPERIPVQYPYDWRQSDIINVEVVNYFQGQDRKSTEWGFRWSHLENELTMGQPEQPLIRDWSDLKKFRAPDPGANDRFDLMRKMRAELGGKKYYKANFVLTGFGVMSCLRGFARIMEDFYLERENVERLADIVFGFEEGLIRLLKPQGFDAVGFADDWGTQQNLFISPALWREVFKPRYKRQIELAHDCGLDFYFHCCGYIYDIIPDFIEIGLDILNPGQPDINGIEKMGRDFSGRLCFACPVSYQTTGISGSPADIRREVDEMVAHLGNRGGGLIGVVPTDLAGLGAGAENVRAMFDAFRAGYAPKGGDTGQI